MCPQLIWIRLLELFVKGNVLPTPSNMAAQELHLTLSLYNF
jgi:hypothetical protein